MVKLCKDCKWCEFRTRLKFRFWRGPLEVPVLDDLARCTRPDAVSLVTGLAHRAGLEFLCNERGRYGDCGPEGKFWEPR